MERHVILLEDLIDVFIQELGHVLEGVDGRGPGRPPVYPARAVLPMTHVNTLMRGLWMGHGWLEHVNEVIILVAILIGGVTISAKIFRWE